MSWQSLELLVGDENKATSRSNAIVLRLKSTPIKTTSVIENELFRLLQMS